MNTSLFTSKTIFFLLLFISTTAIFHSCVKEQDFFNTPSGSLDSTEGLNSFNPDEIIFTSIFGSVVDESGNPVENSKVSLKTLKGIQNTTTDENGSFFYINQMVLKDGALLKVHQAGKFGAFRKMSLTKDSYNYTKIKLLDKNSLGSIPSVQGGILQDVSSTAKVTLAANSVRYENGESYTGNVEVAMSWIDPTSEDLASRMVGDLSGIDKDGKEVALSTFGMLNVELLGEDGEELQLKEGMPATLSFPVPNDVLAQAPPTIPLWSFDEELGTWVEEGSATLQDGYYVGEVAHFSSWNVDWKGERMTLKGKVFTRINEEDFIVPYFHVKVNIGGIQQAGGFLDDSGEFMFYNFPKNMAFTLSISTSVICGDVLWEEELGPYEDDTDLGTIVILAPESHFVTISGLGMDCDGNALTDGYVRFSSNNSISVHPLLEEAGFEFTVNRCENTEGQISVVDLANFKLGAPQTIDISEASVNVGTLTACDEINTYMEVYLSGEEGTESFSFDEASVSFDVVGGESTMTLFGKISDGNNDPTIFNFVIKNVTEPGVYEDGDGYLSSPDGFTTYLYPNYVPIILVDFGENTGSIIEGTFGGNVLTVENGNDLGYSQNISGSFRLIR